MFSHSFFSIFLISLFISSVQSYYVTTIATPQQCPGASSVFKDQTTGVVYAACKDGNSVISIQNGTVNTITTQCVTPVSVFKDITRGILYMACEGNGILSINGSSVTTLLDKSQCYTPYDVKSISTGIVYASCTANILSMVDGNVTVVANYAQYGVSRTLYTDSDTVYAAVDTKGLIIHGSNINTIFDAGAAITAIYKDSNTGVIYLGTNSLRIEVLSGTVHSFIPTIVECGTVTSICTYSGIIYVGCTYQGSLGGVISINGSVISSIVPKSDCSPFATSLYCDQSSGIVYVTCQNQGVISITPGTKPTKSNENNGNPINSGTNYLPNNVLIFIFYTILITILV